ncbi:MAG: glycoside hydrolase family 27 protein [Acidobacteriaceae bacterium]|nr:glycoside hydrolase family 27 protein [Acidobacteriaceae bacterium]
MKSFFALLLLPFLGSAANLTGKWSVTYGADGTVRETSLFLKAQGDSLTGYMVSHHGNELIQDGKVNGDSFSFSIIQDNFGEQNKLKYTGRLEGDTLLLQLPGSDDHRGRELHMKQVSTETPGPMPEAPKKISLPAAKPVSYNGLAKTPPMGWNSWNKFANKVTDQLIRETADAMVSSGMEDAGYIYVNIDDTWEAGRDARGNIQTNSKFPDMKALADYVHSKGLKLGIYSSPGPKTCGGFEGSFQHEEQDAKTYASWDIDFLKYDWCSASQVYDYHSMPAVYAKMGDALQRTGRPIVYSLCQYGVFHGPKWGASVGGNSWRTTGDISDNWKSMSHIGFDLQEGLAQYAGPGHWNDPDMLEVGNGGMTEIEYRTHMSLWSLLAAPLLAGNDLRSISPAILQMLTNKDVIAIDQDPLGKEATRISKNGDLEVWARPLADGGEAVGLFNRGTSSAKIATSKSDLKLNGNFSVRDIWAAADRGRLENEFSAEVPSHGVVLLKLEPAQ